MKKLLLFFSATLFALGTAFAQAVLPTADLFAVQGPETSYDESAGTVTFTWQISLAESADVQWSDFVGQEAQVWFNNTLSAPNTVISEDGQVVSKTFSGAQDGSEIAYKLVFACGTSEKYQGTAVTLQESTYTPEGSVEPEPEPAETWYITGDGADKDYWCGGKNWDPAGLELTLDGEVYVYSTTVQAGTYNFKITNGGWYDPESNPDGINYGYTNVNSAASTSGYEEGGGNNVRFTVAAEAQITITLDPAAAEDAKITLDSSVDFGQPEITRWTLTGAVPFFVGDGDWSFYEDNDLVETEEDGVWTITYEAVQVTAEQANQSYEYKAGANGGYTVGEFPRGGNQTFTMPEAGVYNITFTLNTNKWTLAEDVTPKGPDALYLRGDMGGLGWHDNETNPDNMADWALATTTDNIVYVWDWSDAPRELAGNFKFGRLQTAEEVAAGQGWGGLADGVYGTDGVSEVTEDLGSYPIATPGGNFNMGGNTYFISKITLDLISMTVTFEYDEPTAVEEAEALAVSASNGRIYADGEFTIVNLAGQDVTAANGSLQGTYIVITGDDAVKVYVD